MNAFDQIIGYGIIRKELERTADALKNPEVYRVLGVSTPRGLLLHGEPGVGKSLMANCLMEESGRNVLMLRRDKPDGDFVRAIKDTFEKAAADSPSIVFLDDMDKFAKAEEHCSNQEEFVAVQAAIDSVKDKDIFVLATANDLDVLPDSLIRAGRFDQVIEVRCPDKNDAPKIIAHFLADKPLAKDVDTKTVARLLSGRSCAELETAVNSAGMLAAYERCPSITMRHMIMGCVTTTRRITADQIIPDRTDDPLNLHSQAARAACHEAGHVVVSEVLSPGSVTLACIHERQNSTAGFVSVESLHDPLLEERINRVVLGVSGHIALELHFGVVDGGACADFDIARSDLFDMICSCGYLGYDLLGDRYDSSPGLQVRQEQAVANEMARCVGKAKQILGENRTFLEAMITALLQKGLLTGEDIQKIKHSSTKDCVKLSVDSIC